MARLTKAEKLAKAAAEAELRKIQEMNEYPKRLMTVLELASRASFEIKVKEGVFQVTDAQQDIHILTYEYTEDSGNVLNDLEWEISWRIEQAEEELRQYNVRRAALDKLTEEEKFLLGL